jgi:hypothetical protein
MLRFFRWALAVVSILLAIWVLVSIIQAFKTTPDQIKTINYDEYLAATLEFVRQDAERFFQLAVLVLGGLWTLAIIDDTHHLTFIKIPEIIMFVTANGLLIACCYFIQLYGDVIKQVYWDVHKLSGNSRPLLFPDFLHSPYIDLHYEALIRCFYSGLIVSALVALSLCRLQSGSGKAETMI